MSICQKFKSLCRLIFAFFLGIKDNQPDKIIIDTTPGKELGYLTVSKTTSFDDNEMYQQNSDDDNSPTAVNITYLMNN